MQCWKKYILSTFPGNIIVFQGTLAQGCHKKPYIFSAVGCSVLRPSHLAGWFPFQLFKLGEQPAARTSLWTHIEKLRLSVGSDNRLQQKTALYLPVW